MKSKAPIVLVFLVAVLLIVAVSVWAAMSKVAGPVAPPAGGGPATPVAATTISMIYSTEKKDWIEAAHVEFEKAHPEIAVELHGMGSIEAAEAIVDGKEKPTIFSPADSLILNLLATDWDAKYHGSPYAAGSTPEPLVITPLVFCAWEDRGAVLEKASGGKIGWKAIHDAAADNRGWPAIGGKSEWGFVKLGHTNPTLSNSGLQALVLMTMDYYGRTHLDVADVLDPKYQAWLLGMERGVSKFEESTGTFMTDMVRFGPSKYDLAVVYESTAIGQIENAQGRWGNLKVYYPQTTLWSDHPVALMTDGVTPQQAAAAKVWIEWLRSRPMQERALTYGFRPGDTAVPIQSSDANNPFVKFAPYGVQVEIPPVAELPDGAVVRNLMTMWSRVVAQR